jgi:predicted NBD/HSP70 family sugar kinase
MLQQKRHRHERITRINPQVARDINRSIILNSVRQNQPISRTRISELTRLNKSTVSVIVASLLEEELLVERPDRNGGIGRNPVNLSVRQGKHFVGAISFDSPRTTIAIVDIDGTIRAREEIVTQAVSPRTLVPQCLARIRAMRHALGAHRFRGIGATVAGMVDPAQGRVIYASNLAWNDFDLTSAIRELEPDVESISVENDANASALAEILLGTHDLPTMNLVFVWIGVGIGAGVAVHGRILSGWSHAAGEVGHMTLADHGAPCVCGNTGCWVAYSSDGAVVNRFRSLKQTKLGDPGSATMTTVLAASAVGDDAAQTALRESAEAIGIGIANITKAYDPEAIIVGGTPTHAWDLVSPVIIESARRHAFPKGQPGPAILATTLRDVPSLLGAAALCIRHVFTDYRVTI